MEKTILATVQFIDISGGFWGFIGDDGEKWRAFPDDFPQELKQDGLRVEICANLLEDVVSFVMWGTEIDIISWSYVQPSDL
jgi:hypothetical protein